MAQSNNGFFGTYAYVYCTADVISESASTNTSVVRVTAYSNATGNQSYYTNDQGRICTISIDGQTKNLSIAGYYYYPPGPDNLGSWDFSIDHGTTGYRSVSFGATLPTGVGTGTCSGTLYLGNFDRTPNTPNTPSLSRGDNGTDIYMSTATSIKNSGPGVDKFHWYYSTDNVNWNFLQENAKSPVSNSDAWTWTTANPTSTYYFRVYAHNGDTDSNPNGTGNGWSAASASAGIYGAPTAPGTPTAIGSTSVAGQINVSWAHSSSNLQLSQYDIYRNGVYLKSTTGNWAANSITDTGLARGSIYTYTVYGYNSSGWSAISGTSSTAMAPGVPNAPATPTVSSKVGRTVTINSARGSFGYGNVVSEYRVQLSTDNGTTWKGWDNTSKSFTANNTYNTLDSSGNFTYTLLTPALTYKWRVFAVNSIGTGDIATMSSGTFVSAGGRRFRGTGELNSETWQPTENAKRYTGTQWVDLTVAKKYDPSYTDPVTGSHWKDLT